MVMDEEAHDVLSRLCPPRLPLTDSECQDVGCFSQQILCMMSRADLQHGLLYVSAESCHVRLCHGVHVICGVQEAVGLHMEELVGMQRSILALYAPLSSQEDTTTNYQPQGANVEGGVSGAPPAVPPLRLTKQQLRWRQMRLEDSLTALALSPGPLSAGEPPGPQPCSCCAWLPILTAGVGHLLLCYWHELCNMQFQ